MHATVNNKNMKNIEKNSENHPSFLIFPLSDLILFPELPTLKKSRFN